MFRRSRISAALVLASLALPACSQQSATSAPTPAAAPVAASTVSPAPATVRVPTHAGGATAAIPLPPVIVHKNPSCGCCGSWVEHMRKAGFAVEVRDEDNLNAIKEQLGVPVGKGSCHTAEIDGYVVEGHVPADDIKRLLAEHPDARGLVLPGMPVGSPGMESPDGSVQAYTVELVRRDGSTVPYAAHGE